MGIEFNAKKNVKYTLKILNPSPKKIAKMIELGLSHKHLQHQILKS